jgi:DNA-binding NarL/FixJ family response regulator
LHHPLSFDAPISGDDWEDFDENRTLHDAIPAKTSDVSGEMIRKERLEILEGIEAKFSEREKQVAELLKEGLNQLEIARELGIGVSSVRSYIDRIREKIFPDYNRF